MSVTAIVNTKGGSSKTTTCVSLAAAAGEWWGPTVVLDADITQQSAFDWVTEWQQSYEARATTIKPPLDVRAVTPAEVEKAVAAAKAEGYEHIFVDTIGTGLDPKQILPVLAVADTLLIPAADSVMDLHAIQPTVDLATQAAQDNPDLSVLVVLTQVRSGTKATTTVRDTIVDPIGLTVLDSVIPMMERLKQGMGAPIGRWNPAMGVAYELLGKPTNQ